MLLGRAFVRNVDTRSTVAVLALAASVAYAALAGGAAAGLQDAADIVSPEGLNPETLATHPEGDAFPHLDDATTHLTLATHNDTLTATLTPWPNDQNPYQGPYAPPDAAQRIGLNLTPETRTPDAGPGHALYLPPSTFHDVHPHLEGHATHAFLPPGTTPPTGLDEQPARGAGLFYAQGAEQLTGSVHGIVIAMGLLAAVLAAGALRLETLARRNELATLETIAGKRTVKRVIIARATTLSLAGAILGIAAALALTRVGNAIAGTPLFTPSTLLLLEAGLAGFLAGAIAGSAAGLLDLRAPLAQRAGKRGSQTRRFPGPLRFLIVSPRIFLGVFLAALVATTIIGTVIGVSQTGERFFGAHDETTLLGAEAQNPFTGNAPRFLAEHLPLLDEIDDARAETYAPTLLHGEPILVRGTPIEQWRDEEDAQLIQGEWPTQPAQASIGARASDRLDIQPGDTLTVPTSYRSGHRTLHVTSIHADTGLGDDQILTDLDTAGDLASKERHQANIVRVQTPTEDAQRALQDRGIHATNLTLTPTNPQSGTRATAHLDLTNLADHREQRTLTLTVNDDVAETQTVTMGPHTTRTLEMGFRVPDTANIRLNVNPETTAQTTPGSLTITHPTPLIVNQTNTLTVRTPQGDPQPQALITLDDDPHGETDDRGRLDITPQRTGRLLLEADTPTGGASTYVPIIQPAWAHRPHLTITHAHATPPQALDLDQARYDATVQATNLGGQPYEGPLAATHQDETLAQTPLTIPPYETRTTTLTFTAPLTATNITIHDATLQLRAPTPDDDAPRTLDEILQTVQQRHATQDDETEATLAPFFDAIGPVTTAIVLLTAAHAAVAIGLTVLRETREREPITRTLQNLGATREDLGTRAARDSLLALALPLTLGILLAVALLTLLHAQSYPIGFGHTLPADLSLPLLARTGAALATIGAATAITAAATQPEPKPRQAPPRPLDEMMDP